MITLDHSPVHSDPKRIGGTLVFVGTRVPAQTLLDYLQYGKRPMPVLGEIACQRGRQLGIDQKLHPAAIGSR